MNQGKNIKNKLIVSDDKKCFQLFDERILSIEIDILLGKLLERATIRD